MPNFDLCLAWSWEYDADFIDALERACHARLVSVYQALPTNLEFTLAALESGDLRFCAFFDRASDADESFKPLVTWAEHHAHTYLNRYHTARRAWNKASMHYQVVTAGLEAPWTVVLPSLAEQPELPPVDLSPLGGSFAIKPVHGGGGVGVVTGANSWEQVLSARLEVPEDMYLLQAQVEPVQLDGRSAWFRLLYCLGEVYACWWDTTTHIYTPIESAEIERYALHPLRSIPHTLAGLCQLELFSTEVALTPQGRFLVVDYINDPIDLRPQSKAAEAVPDPILKDLVQRMADYLSNRCGMRSPI